MEFHSTHYVFFAAMHREIEFKMFISLLINDNFFSTFYAGQCPWVDMTVTGFLDVVQSLQSILG